MHVGAQVVKKWDELGGGGGGGVEAPRGRRKSAGAPGVRRVKEESWAKAIMAMIPSV